MIIARLLVYLVADILQLLEEIGGCIVVSTFTLYGFDDYTSDCLTLVFPLLNHFLHLLSVRRHQTANGRPYDDSSPNRHLGVCTSFRHRISSCMFSSSCSSRGYLSCGKGAWGHRIIGRSSLWTGLAWVQLNAAKLQGPRVDPPYRLRDETPTERWDYGCRDWNAPVVRPWNPFTNERIARSGEPGLALYRQLSSSSALGIPPLCLLYNPVSTIHHYQTNAGESWKLRFPLAWLEHSSTFPFCRQLRTNKIIRVYPKLPPMWKITNLEGWRLQNYKHCCLHGIQDWTQGEVLVSARHSASQGEAQR